MEKGDTSKFEWLSMGVRALARIAISEAIQTSKEAKDRIKSRGVAEPALHDVRLELIPEQVPDNVIRVDFGDIPDLAA